MRTALIAKRIINFVIRTPFIINTQKKLRSCLHPDQSAKGFESCGLNGVVKFSRWKFKRNLWMEMG